MSNNGILSRQSRHSVAETVRLLEAAIVARGLIVFATIDHGANAVDHGLVLRPTVLVVFGHPRGGTPLMQDRQVVGLDLPFKALVWEEVDGKAWLAYNDANWLVSRHGLSAGTAAIAEQIATGMIGIVAAACD